jgi:hypothetical protein
MIDAATPQRIRPASAKLPPCKDARDHDAVIIKRAAKPGSHPSVV